MSEQTAGVVGSRLLADKVVVIAGASAGVGLAAACRCAREGAHVVMLARGAERLASAAAEVGDRALPIVCDIAEPDELKADNIRICQYVAGSVGGNSFGDNFGAGEAEAAYPEWLASGYLSRVAGPGMEPDWMADSIVFALTRPRGQMIDVIHVRSFAPGHSTDVPVLGG